MCHIIITGVPTLAMKQNCTPRHAACSLVAAATIRRRPRSSRRRRAIARPVRPRPPRWIASAERHSSTSRCSRDGSVPHHNRTVLIPFPNTSNRRELPGFEIELSEPRL